MIPIPRLLRAAALGIAVLSAVGLANGARAATADEAAEFIRDMGHKAIAELADESIPMDKREESFRALVDKGFAMDTISRFVLGRYARVASEEEMKEFRDVFLRVVAAQFLPVFEGYTKDDFRVEGAQKDSRGDNLFIVNTLVRSPTNDQFANARWRVQNRDNGFQIVDVVAEGASMAITLRSEYSSVIQQNGGKVSALIDKLQTKLNKGNVGGVTVGESDQ